MQFCSLVSAFIQAIVYLLILTILKLFVLLIAAIAGYIVLLVIYGVCANSFYKRKHAVAKQNVKRYYRNLSRLEKTCKKEKNEQ